MVDTPVLGAGAERHGGSSPLIRTSFIYVIILLMNEHNPYDQTVWDPLDAEHAVEDPFHGPTAVHDLLSIPPMPLGDGTWYQPGGFYASGTVYVDAEGQPIYKIGTGFNTSATMREQRAVAKWIEAYNRGELTADTAPTERTTLEIQTIDIDESVILDFSSVDTVERRQLRDKIQESRKFYKGIDNITETTEDS